jgi:hypothetical protein
VSSRKFRDAKDRDGALAVADSISVTSYLGFKSIMWLIGIHSPACAVAVLHDLGKDLTFFVSLLDLWSFECAIPMGLRLFFCL